MDNNNLESVDFYNDLKNDVKPDPGFTYSDDQPLLGKVGSILLVSNVLFNGTDFKYYIWGIENDKPIFSISITNNYIFDDSGHEIFTTKGSVKKVLLPNGPSN